MVKYSCMCMFQSHLSGLERVTYSVSSEKKVAWTVADMSDAQHLPFIDLAAFRPRNVTFFMGSTV